MDVAFSSDDKLKKNIPHRECLTKWDTSRPDSLRQLHHGSDDDEKMSASTSKELPLLASNLRFQTKIS